MKIRRYKKLNKTLGFFINNFGFRQPYQLLVDGTFCYAALNNKVNVADNIPKYLQGETKLITTQCSIIELEKLGHKLNGALLILKQYVVHKCGHEGKPIPGSKCLLSMLGKDNKSHYVLCTQDRELQNEVRSLPGVPLLYLHMKTPVLEKASSISVEMAKQKMAGLTESEIQALQRLKETDGPKVDRSRFKKRKNKKHCALASNKKKAQQPLQTAKTDTGKERRKRIRIPQHVREELLKNQLK
ncbi:rRNA-processing protein UTP23 homolog [Cylas formicarius]|uniref:rRNA-processing protein UTP23 homolog n=1 Tax=Cylas formicarius TaxID=197179 RepID=UPI002958A9F0|nr:rRNA-processing protein UTP23 homolog [Cylas formicarius]